MKAAFLNCMKHLYPQGVTSREQLRDLIHAFSMGWAESFKHVVETERPPVLRELRMAAVSSAVEAWQANGKEAAAPGWLPDASWQWWETAPVARAHHIHMINGVPLKSALVWDGPPQLGQSIPHLGKIIRAQCYHQSFDCSLWTVVTQD